MEYVIFDMEVFPNWWCMVYTQPGDMSDLRVITSETPYYLKWIRDLKIKRCLVGFNIKKYDLRILNAIEHGCDPYQVYETSKDIIENDEDESTNPYNNYYFWNRYNFSDLYDDWRFGSLKEFESNIGMDIQESEVSFDKEHLTEEDKIDVINYCKHDVEATVKLFEFRKDYIDSKIMLSEMYNIPLHKALKSTNAKLCALVLNAEACYRPLDDKFRIPQKVESYIKNSLPKDVVDLFDVLNNDSKEVTLFDNLIVFGIGGIHSTRAENSLFKTDDKYQLINIDVTSYYPNLMMNFNYMSRNISDPDLYRHIYDLRVELKKQAGEEAKINGKTDKWKKLNSQQNALKLILNTTYGATKNQYNALYDEYQASSLCYLGQLLLASLANNLYNKLNAVIVQTNTDGILIKIEKDKIDKVKELVKEWEELTGFTMEYDYIVMFFQRDVNNYIEVTDNPKKPFKLKGKWTNQADVDTTSVPNLNAPITHKALLNYYLHNIPLEETIKNCTDIMDFCFTCKTGKNYDKTYYYINNEPRNANKVNRVVATTNTSLGTLKKYKKDEDRYDKIAEIPEHCLLLNGVPKMIDNLDYDWYVEFATNKLKELKEM